MTDAPVVDSSYIVKNAFVSEGVSVPVADILAVEVSKTWVGKLPALVQWIFGAMVLVTGIRSCGAIADAASGDPLPSIFWAACVCLGIAALADWLKKTFCTRLTLRTHHQTVQVRVSEQNAWKMYGAIDRARKQEVHRRRVFSLDELR